MAGLKINYFTTRFPYNQPFKQYSCGGSTLAAYYLAINMAKRNHEINVFTTSANSKDSVEKIGNITIHRFGTNLRILSSNISLRLFKDPSKYYADIAHTHFDIPPGPLVGLKYAKKKKVPLIVTYHGDWVESYGGIIRRIGVAFHNKFLVDKLLSHAVAIISPSNHYINESRFLRKFREKVIVIPNGINLMDFDIHYSKEECRKSLGIPLDKNILLFVGYLSIHKGPDILINAMKNVLKKVPKSELIFVGDGIMRNELEKLSKKLNLEKSVKFVGFVEDIFIKSFYYKSADVFVLPSFSECFPIVNLEAMASGVPIVASNVGGIPDVVKDGENGLLVPPGSSEILADAIIHLLENDDLRERMGRNGRKKVENYSWEKIADETEKIYTLLVGN